LQFLSKKWRIVAPRGNRFAAEVPAPTAKQFGVGRRHA
jgi:hypothetical protein